MDRTEFDVSGWIDRLATELVVLDRVHKPYLNEYLERNSSALVQDGGHHEAVFPLDDAQMLYTAIRHNMAFGEEVNSEPLHKVLDRVRHVLLSHPTLERVAVSGRSIGENDFWMSTLNSGSSISASDLIAGLMARSSDLSDGHFMKAVRELHAFLSPPGGCGMDDFLENLDEGCDILPFYGLAVTERIELSEGLSLFPLQEIKRFLDEELLQEISPKDAVFHNWWCGGAVANTYRWRPAFRQRGCIDEPLWYPPQTQFSAVHQLIDLIAVSHETPVFPLALISGCIDSSAGRLLGTEKHGPGMYQKLSVGNFRFAQCPTIRKEELDRVLEVFKKLQRPDFNKFHSYLSRLATALRRNERHDGENRIVDVAIVLEAMYELPKSGKTQALACRVSDFLGTGEEDRVRLEGNVRDFYNVRSEIVHGVSKAAASFRNDVAFVRGFNLARRSFFKLVMDRPPDDWEKQKSTNRIGVG